MLADDSVTDLYQKYQEFKEDVGKCHLGKTSQFWMDYIDKIWLVLRFMRATKENDIDLYISTLLEMLPLFFAYEKYAKYLSVYVFILIKLDSTHQEQESFFKITDSL